jgi:hypothetical protein
MVKMERFGATFQTKLHGTVGATTSTATAPGLIISDHIDYGCAGSVERS